MSEEFPGTLIDALRDVSLWARTENIPLVVVGGVAASLLGRPRLTRDIDVLVSVPESGWGSLLQSGARFGLYPRIADPVEFARRTRVLLFSHKSSAIDVDIILGALPFEETAIANAAIRKIADFEVNLPRVEDLLVMKAIAHRPRDLADIEGLLVAHAEVDVDSVRQWVREFALATTMPEILEDFDRTTSKVRHGR